MVRRPATRVAVLWALAVGVVLDASPPAFAWGQRGHRVAALVAQPYLTPTAAKAIRELLLEGDSIVTVSTWADEHGRDEVPQSSPWHYVNVPLSAAGYDDRYCDDRRGCVVDQIRRFRRDLADARTPKIRRQQALLFLVHFIQDVHQPLHVGDNGDKGGNDTQVQFLGDSTNLHRVWDSDVIRRAGGSERDWARDVSALLTPERVAAWTRGDVADWANESHRAAKLAYFYPKNARQPLRTGSRLGDDYLQFAAPIVRERLAQAGIRLAHELNTLFDPGYKGPPVASRPADSGDDAVPRPAPSGPRRRR